MFYRQKFLYYQQVPTYLCCINETPWQLSTPFRTTCEALTVSLHVSESSLAIMAYEKLYRIRNRQLQMLALNKLVPELDLGKQPESEDQSNYDSTTFSALSNPPYPPFHFLVLLKPSRIDRCPGQNTDF